MKRFKKVLLSTIAVVTAGTMVVMPVCAAPATANQATAEEVQMTRITKQSADSIRSLFDAEFYAARYPDVAKAYGNNVEALFQHFINVGIKEGRQPGKAFNVNAYASCYKDIAAAFGKDLVGMYIHYLQIGKAEGRTLVTVEAANIKGIQVRSSLTNKPLAENGYTFQKVAVTPTESTSETTTVSKKKTKEITAKPVYTYRWLPLYWNDEAIAGNHGLAGQHIGEFYADGKRHQEGDVMDEHTYVDGVCKWCGAEMENEVHTDGTPVWDEDGNRIDYQEQQGEPEQGEPEQGEPEQGEPEQGEPEQGEPEQGEPEQGEPEQGEPEQGEPEQGEPEQGEPEQGEPEQGEPEQGEPEQGEPEQGEPEQVEPEQGEPEQGEPEQQV